MEGIALQDLWLTVRKRLWLVFGIMAGFLALGGLVTFEKTPLCSSTVELLLKSDTPQVLAVPQLQVIDLGIE